MEMEVSNNLVPLEMMKQWDKYSPGEYAGFEPELARKLVDKGYARPDPRPIARKKA